MTTHTNKNAKSSATRKHHTGIANTLREMRQAKGLTLTELAKRCALATSTLSKIENGQMSPTYDTILQLADGLDIDVTELFAPKQTSAVNGRRAVTMKDTGIHHVTDQYDYEMLCTELAQKQFIPLRATIRANSAQNFGRLLAHPGEEFVFVLSGALELHTQFYAPTQLTPGDCTYFDSTMGHALVNTSPEPAEVLWICSQVVAPLKA